MNKTPFTFLLKNKIDILFKNSNEFETDNWIVKYSLFAQVERLCKFNVRTIEKFKFGNSNIKSYFLFRIRYIEGIFHKMRISFNKKLFFIKKIIDEHEKNEILILVALLIGEDCE